MKTEYVRMPLTVDAQPVCLIGGDRKNSTFRQLFQTEITLKNHILPIACGFSVKPDP